jgi:hypothetical protein
MVAAGTSNDDIILPESQRELKGFLK